MQAKERRHRHFKSSVGLMLNENYGDGLIPNTVQSQDFLYMPASDIPMSGPAIAFLEARLQEPQAHKPRSIGTSDSLYQAYRRAFGQPVGMVHYDRDPYYWQSKDRPSSDLGSLRSTSSSRLRNYDAVFNGYERGQVSEIEPASTVKSISTAKSSRSLAPRPSSEITTSAKAPTKDGDSEIEDAADGENRSGVKIPGGRIGDNPHRLWTPGPEASGFKPYSPFSDSLQDFGKIQEKYVAPEIKPVVDRTCDVIAAPVYKNARNRVLEISTQSKPSSKNDKEIKADVLKLHGNPEYPNKVMEDKDVPNYIAWTKIYPYCPLTQIEGKERPVVVPPRGFTPSTPSKVGTIPKLRDIKKEKRKIMEGIKLLSASSKAKRSGDSQTRNQAVGGNPEGDGDIHPSLKTLPPSLAAKLNPVAKRGGRDLKFQNSHNNNNNNNKNERIANATFSNDNKHNDTHGVSGKQSSPSSSLQSVGYDPHVNRKLLDMKIKAPNGWYGGQTPTHTPTPDPTLPVKATLAWAKHYSPARIRRFMTAVGGNFSTPEAEQF